ncbi:MAG: hypothetical protein KC613_09130 [Myxococcales bacterium]|nr:hypothetical protein [Myxococcales bacterium]
MRRHPPHRRLAPWLVCTWILTFLVGPRLHLSGRPHVHSAPKAPTAAPLFTLGPDDVFALPPAAPAHEAAQDHVHGGDDPSHLKVALLALPPLPRPALLPGRPFRARAGAAHAGHRPGWWVGAPARGPPA